MLWLSTTSFCGTLQVRCFIVANSIPVYWSRDLRSEIMEDTPDFSYNPATSPCRAGVRPHRDSWISRGMSSMAGR